MMTNYTSNASKKRRLDDYFSPLTTNSAQSSFPEEIIDISNIHNESVSRHSEGMQANVVTSPKSKIVFSYYAKLTKIKGMSLSSGSNGTRVLLECLCFAMDRIGIGKSPFENTFEYDFSRVLRFSE